MNSRTESSIPFVGLHAHSVADSPFDALGYPPDHMEFAYQNGMDVLALTDHGNMNGLAWQVLHAKKMKKGKDPLSVKRTLFHLSRSGRRVRRHQGGFQEEVRL